jgi:hypothetical protein
MSEITPELSADPRRDAAKHVLSRKKQWEESMKDWRISRARLDKRYYNFREDFASMDSKASATPRANIGVPLAAETVDTAVARAYDSFFRTQPYGKVWGREGTDQYAAEVVQQVVDYQQQVCNLPIVAQKLIRDAFKYGLGVGKLHFKKELKRVPVQYTAMERISASFTGEELPPFEDRVVNESPVLEHVHIQDVFFQRDAQDEYCAEGIIHRTWETKEQVMHATDGLGLPLYDTQVLSEVGTGSGKDSDSELQSEYTTRKITEGGLAKDNKLEILEYVGRLPLEIAQALASFFDGADPYADWIVTVVAGRDTPLRVEPCPYLTNKRMFLFCKVIDDPGYMTGISIIEFVERLGLTIDELYNIVLDNMNFVINKQYYINELAGIDEADVVSSPGKIIRGKRPFNEAMGVIQTPDISQSVFMVLNMLMGHYKEYTGIANTTLGVGTAGTDTATEISAIVRASSTRLGQFERMIEDTLMRPLFERWTVLNQQFLTQEFVIRVFKDGQPIYPKVAPEDIQGVFDFRFEGATRSESIALLTGQIMQMLQINATQPVPIFDPIYLGKKLADAWGWSDASQAMNPQFQPQFQMYQKLMMMKTMGETAKALTPDQQAASKSSGNKAKQGNAAQPNNTGGTQDFRATLAAVKENALPQMPTEGGAGG